MCSSFARLVLLLAAAVMALAGPACAWPVLPKTDANDGLNGDNPYFQRWNVARACEDDSATFWYSSGFRQPGEPDPAGEQWVDYKPPLSILGPGRYHITANYRQTSSRASYDVLYTVHHAAGTTTLHRSQFGYGIQDATFDLGEFDLGSTGWVRVQDTGSESVAFDQMSFTYLGPLEDHEPPSVPANVQAVPLSPSSIQITWTASTDNVGVAGYHVFRGGSQVGTTAAAAFIDTGLNPQTTYSYTVCAFDQAGNESAQSSPPAQATTEPPSEIVFDFDDRGSTVYTYGSSPNTFYTAAEGSQGADHWFGKKSVPTGDGSVYWGLASGSNNYRFEFASSGGDGSLAIQTQTPASQDGSLNGAAYVATNDFANWFKWTKDGDYYRGISVEADMEIVGDANGWCAPYGSIPGVYPCAWTSDFGHQGSDWGSARGNRAMLYIAVAKSLELTEPGRTAGSGNTGDGVAYWISAQANDVANPDDDRVRFQSHTYNYDHGTFRFRDGLGLGLAPEDGSANGCKDGAVRYPRNGVIEGQCNHIKMKVGAVNAGGNSEYFDVWITRPDGNRIHVDPVTCDWIDSDQNLPNKPGFGADGHTLELTYSNKDSTKSILRLGSASTNGFWGVSFDRIKITNDWNARVETRVSRLSELAGMPVGTPVSFDSTGGEKIVTTASQSVDWQPPYFFYIEQADRTSGIRIVNTAADPHAVQGSCANASGVLQTDADGNLYVDVADGHCVFSAAAATVSPLGVTRQTGLDTTGLLAAIWGRVTSAGTDLSGNVWFVLEGGWNAPVMCRDYACDGIRGSPAAGDYWMVTGPLAREAGSPLLIVDAARKVSESLGN